MEAEKQKILQAIALLETQRPLLGDAAVEAALASLRLSLEKLEKAAAPSPPKTPSMEGERKLVTVMFADFSNFTSMSERLDAEEVRDVMNQCFSLLVPVIEHYGGVIDKFIGDEIMALFGAPHTHDNDAECALRAALEMMQQLAEFNTKHGTNLGLHFGINTGTVIAGGVGSIERQQYSVMGDAVNLAARLEDASVTGEILVGHETYRLTAPLFDFEVRSPISVKGKAQPVAIYRLMGLKPIPKSVRGIDGLRSPMIGRDTHLSVLKSALSNLKYNQGKAIAIIAESGLGKSRLLLELRESSTEVAWIEARGQSYAQRDNYGVATLLINSALSFPPTMSATQVGEELMHYLQRHSPQQANELYPYLARLRGIPLDDITTLLFKAIQPEVMQARIEQAFAQWLSIYCAGEPLVVVWEDLHWSDDSSLRLIEHLIQQTPKIPLLHLLVFRPQEGLVQTYQQKWAQYSAYYQQVELAPLTHDESNALVENLLRIKNLPNTTRNVILEKAEGNPFYLEELLRSLLDTGLLYWQDGEIQLREEVDKLHIPNTLQAVIEARIDRLNIQEKSILQNASVIGRLFGRQVLEYLVEQSKKQVILNPTLQSLQERELIRQRMVYEYIFKHAVTQEVSYNTLLITRRRELHQYAAEALETLFENQKEEMASALAWHFQRAKNHVKAIHYLTIAADKARLTYSYHEADYYYTEALREAELASDVDWRQKVMLYEHQGEVRVLLGNYDQARQSYQYALQAIATFDVLLQASIWRKIGESYVPQRMSNQELVAYDAAIKLLGPPDQEASTEWWQIWIELQLSRTWSLYWLNNVVEMEATLKDIQGKTEKVGTVRQQSLWQSRWILFLIRSQRFVLSEEQIIYAENALSWSYQIQDFSLITYHTSLLGMGYYVLRKLQKAKEELLKAVELAQKLGNAHIEVVSYQFLNLVGIASNDPELVAHFTPLMEEKAASQLPFYLFAARGFAAWVAWKKGDLQEAEKLVMEALKLHNGVPVPNSTILWTLVAIKSKQKKYSEAVAQLQAILLPYQYQVPAPLEQQMKAMITLLVENPSIDCHDEFERVLKEAQIYGFF